MGRRSLRNTPRREPGDPHLGRVVERQVARAGSGGGPGMTTLERLQALLARDFGLAPAALDPGATLESLDIDSLRMIEILFCIEDEFKVTVSAEQAELRARLKTLGDLAAYIETLIAAPPKAAT